MKKILTALAVAITALAAGCSSGNSGSYRATHDQQIINPATLLITGTVTNTGGAAGTPACDIDASDPGGGYSGSDTITANRPLQPGESLPYSDSIVITGQGAGYVTTVKVSCHS